MSLRHQPSRRGLCSTPCEDDGTVGEPARTFGGRRVGERGRLPLAKAAAPKAHAIFVFPKVTKAGLGIGGQYGEGALLKKGQAVAYVRSAATPRVTITQPS
jgi:hypothetical protein